MSHQLADQAQGLRLLLPDSGRVIAVLSGKGGVGKTFVSTSLAVLAARRGERVVVVDGDLGLANVDVVLRANTRFTIADVIDGRCSLEEAIVTGTQGVSIVAAGSGVGTRLSDGQREQLAAHVAQLRRRFDLVIVDCGAGIGDNVLFLSTLAQSRLLVLTPEPTSMVDGYATIKALADLGQTEVDVVVNCALSDLDAKDTYDRLAAVVERFLSSRVRFVGGIPRDDVVRRAVIARKPVVVQEPGSPAARAVARVAGQLFGPRGVS